MDVVVFGAGSLGSLMGGLLAGAHDVTLVGRAAHVDAIRADGLQLSGLVERTVEPSAATEVGRQSADLVVVTVKAYDTEVAAQALASVEAAAVLSLQNGMGNEEVLAEHVDPPVLAGTTSYGARLLEPGVVECTGVGDVVLGPGPDGRAALDLVESVGGALVDAGVRTRIAAEMAPHRWEKLAVNAGINPVTALARVENGALRDGPASDLAEAAAVEVARVARSAGVDLDDAAARGALRRVTTATAANRSSMLQDVVAGRRTEIDAIAGYVVEHADEPVPVNEALLGLVRAWETGRGLR